MQYFVVEKQDGATGISSSSHRVLNCVMYVMICFLAFPLLARQYIHLLNIRKGALRLGALCELWNLEVVFSYFDVLCVHVTSFVNAVLDYIV